MSVFVAGTDTGVGKTLVSALLLARYARELELVYWKPVATGAGVERDRTTVAELVPGAGTAAEAYLFADAVSPHLAARREGEAIGLERIGARWRELSAVFPGAGFVVEGAGGLLVPLDDEGTLLTDLIATLGLPVVLVARSTLGTINHTLLSLEALARRDLALAGVVLCGPPDAENRRAIERLGGVEVIAEVPRLDAVAPATVAAAAAELDPSGALRPWLARAS
ncbi:MAG: dethiobiotin synthase [Thermoanaerobaculia bacterium]|nr:MAG: dethiobiotin synthase [Thermoanaerobaculia bacterium]